jgi:hypothetical protein
MRRLLLLAGVLVAAGCGGSSHTLSAPGPPVGTPLMPDLSPAPPANLHMQVSGKRWLLQFDSTMVNVGKGSFVLRAKRMDGRWHVVQDILYSGGGGRSVPLQAKLVWGGDGHNHWHIARIAVTRLVALTSSGRTLSTGGLVDHKAGFCFFDFGRWPSGNDKGAHFSRLSCGKRGSTEIGMGLSPGWADVYPFVLPGQSLDVTHLRDGRYRLIARVDVHDWFREASHRNDTTWVDFDLSTHGHLRFATIVKSGPRPRLPHRKL